jgi:hypothetical protein
MRFVVLTSVLLLSACAIVTPFNGPNGRPAYSIRCGMNVDACLAKAGEVCPAGYYMVDRTAGTAIMPSGGSFIAAPQHTLAVECK